MNNVEVIKAVKSDRIVRGKTLDILKVAAYCRVSTDFADQLNSYKSQVAYYTDYIKQNPEWEMVDVYADEAITGTKVEKREGFQRMINDCMQGRINLIITKSISRFARNTLDTLKYVRMLKEKNVAVLFEDEKINTLTMDGELMLVILSSVAQQEVENISANVKKGIKMKMARGDYVGFSECLGYNWDRENKQLIVNEEEAKIVRYIFERYVNGYGSDTIGKELENMGYKTKRGNSSWCGGAVAKIIKNEKYVGDVLFGKTFTADPITKRRLTNFGEEDRFYIKDHHEPIIDRETFELAQRIMKSRNVHRRHIEDASGEARNIKVHRMYDFSSMLRCGFCGTTLMRRTWHSGTEYFKVVWQCRSSIKGGKSKCPHSKGVEEDAIKKAFVKSYQLLYSKDSGLLEEFLSTAKEVLSHNDIDAGIKKAKEELKKYKDKRDQLLNLKLNGLIDDETFSERNILLGQKVATREETLRHLEGEKKEYAETEKRIDAFKTQLAEGEVIEEFNREVFEAVIDHVVVGGYDENGKPVPDLLTFVYKSGNTSIFNAKEYKRQRKNAATHRKITEDPLEGYMEIVNFEIPHSHCLFVDRGQPGIHKIIKDTYGVSAGIIA